MAAKKAPKTAYGHIVCPFCESQQNVFIGANQKYYIGCRNCGPILATGQPYQDYILDRAKTIKQSDMMNGEPPADDAANDQEPPKKDDRQPPEPEQKPAKKGFFDW